MRINCSKPPVSSYDFMRYLCASLTKKKKIVINLDSIVERIHQFKSDNKELLFIFEDIEFRTGLDRVTSNDISEAITTLQTFGLAGKLNPKYEKLIIYLTDEEADEILKDCEENIKKAMMQLADLF